MYGNVDAILAVLKDVRVFPDPDNVNSVTQTF